MKSLSNVNLQLPNETHQRPQTTIEQEVINKIRQLWQERRDTYDNPFRRKWYNAIIPGYLNELRAVRTNREMYQDKFNCSI